MSKPLTEYADCAVSLYAVVSVGATGKQRLYEGFSSSTGGSRRNDAAFSTP